MASNAHLHCPLAGVSFSGLLRWQYRRRLTTVKIMRMQKLFVRLFALLVCIAGSSPAQDDGITWLGDYGEAIRQAKQTNKPIFLEFRCEA